MFDAGVIDPGAVPIREHLAVARAALEFESAWSSSRKCPSEVAQSLPEAPLRIGSAPCTSVPLIRWLVNWIRALTPWTVGAARASWTATGRGSAEGFGPPPVAAIARAVTPTPAATVAAQRAISRRVEMRRKYFTHKGYAP